MKGESGNPAGRRPGAERMRQYLQPHEKKLLDKALAMALAGDAKAMQMVLERLAPPFKAESPPVEIPGLAGPKTLSERADAILDAVGQGILPLEAGRDLLAAITNHARVLEVDEMERRLRELEGLLLV